MVKISNILKKRNKYLDAINNVSHVGHCNPKVVEAAYQQSKLLNTNIRCLHESILDYSSNLIDRLSNKLTTCFFTNFGSETNDLALRIARLYYNFRE